MAQNAEMLYVRTSYAHTDTHVLIRHSQKIDNQMLLPEQARDVIKQIQIALDALEAHKKALAEGRAKPLARAGA